MNFSFAIMKVLSVGCHLNIFIEFIVLSQLVSGSLCLAGGLLSKHRPEQGELHSPAGMMLVQGEDPKLELQGALSDAELARYGIDSRAYRQFIAQDFGRLEEFILPKIFEANGELLAFWAAEGPFSRDSVPVGNPEWAWPVIRALADASDKGFVETAGRFLSLTHQFVVINNRGQKIMHPRGRETMDMRYLTELTRLAPGMNSSHVSMMEMIPDALLSLWPAWLIGIGDSRVAKQLSRMLCENKQPGPDASDELKLLYDARVGARKLVTYYANFVKHVEFKHYRTVSPSWYKNADSQSGQVPGYLVARKSFLCMVDAGILIHQLGLQAVQNFFGAGESSPWVELCDEFRSDLPPGWQNWSDVLRAALGGAAAAEGRPGNMPKRDEGAMVEQGVAQRLGLLVMSLGRGMAIDHAEKVTYDSAVEMALFEAILRCLSYDKLQAVSPELCEAFSRAIKSYDRLAREKNPVEWASEQDQKMREEQAAKLRAKEERAAFHSAREFAARQKRREQAEAREKERQKEKELERQHDQASEAGQTELDKILAEARKTGSCQELTELLKQARKRLPDQQLRVNLEFGDLFFRQLAKPVLQSNLNKLAAADLPGIAINYRDAVAVVKANPDLDIWSVAGEENKQRNARVMKTIRRLADQLDSNVLDSAKAARSCFEAAETASLKEWESLAKDEANEFFSVLDDQVFRITSLLLQVLDEFEIFWAARGQFFEKSDMFDRKKTSLDVSDRGVFQTLTGAKELMISWGEVSTKPSAVIDKRKSRVKASAAKRKAKKKKKWQKNKAPFWTSEDEQQWRKVLGKRASAPVDPGVDPLKLVRQILSGEVPVTKEALELLPNEAVPGEERRPRRHPKLRVFDTSNLEFDLELERKEESPRQQLRKSSSSTHLPSLSAN